MTERIPIKTLLDRFFDIATQVCDEVLAFQPDVVISLMHSGWIPLFAGRELWQRTQPMPFPQIVRVNLGREKLKRFDELENRFGVTNCFVGELESEEVIAFFLAWLCDQTHWHEELRTRIQEITGDVTAPRIIIVDDVISEGSTWLLILGLLNIIYPKAEVRFYSANLEWKDHFFEAWIEARHPDLLETDLFPPKEQGRSLSPAREAAVQMVVGTEDVDPDSLDWKTIGPTSANMELLREYLPVSTWMELPRFVEQTVSNEIVTRANEYSPNPDMVKDPARQLQLGWLIIREIHRQGPITIQQLAKTLGWSISKARYHLDRQVGRGYLVVQQHGPEKRYALSPLTEPGHWHKHPLIDTYWAIPSKVLAGEMPGFAMDAGAESLIFRLRWLLDAGVTYFIDLSHHYADRPEIYERTLLELASEYGKDIKYVAIPTPGRQSPRPKTIQAVIELLDQALEQGHTIYIHDYRQGSTETILGCYFVHRGMSGPEALKELDRVRQGSWNGWKRAPAQERARRLVRRWNRSIP